MNKRWLSQWFDSLSASNDQQQHQYSGFDEVTHELVLYIFSFLEIEQLCIISLVRFLSFFSSLSIELSTKQFYK